MQILSKYPFIYQVVFYFFILSALFTFPALLKLTAPYGRHVRKGWGIILDNRLGWQIMEAPAVFVTTFFAVFNFQTLNFELNSSYTSVFLSLWLLHYIYRGYIFPLRFKVRKKNMPIGIVASGFIFNILNGYLIGYYISVAHTFLPSNWLLSIPFWVGIVIYFVGIFINRQADAILFALRKQGDTGYKIPEGGFYKYISCPNYFGELIQWAGFAILTWSFAGFVFVIWTAANLVPRAFANHQWYKKQFPNYPIERKAIIPFII